MNKKEKGWKKKFYKEFNHRDGCLFELEETYHKNNGVSSCTCGLDEMVKFIQQEIDRAKEEGRKRLVNTIRRAIKENMNNGDTEDRHIQIDLDIVKILNDKDINKMFLEDSYSENLEDGGWGWYS